MFLLYAALFCLFFYMGQFSLDSLPHLQNQHINKILTNVIVVVKLARNILDIVECDTNAQKWQNKFNNDNWPLSYFANEKKSVLTDEMVENAIVVWLILGL